MSVLLKSLDTYRSNIRSAVRGLWSGVTQYYEFFDQMALAIERGFTQAWYEGAKIYGISPEDLTEEEHNAITAQVDKEVMFLKGFGDFIQANSKANGGKLTTMFARAELWASGYKRVRTMGETYAAKDQKQEWVYGDTKHCGDCLNYNGRVYRASVWRKHNIYPQMYSLGCKGYHCQCHLETTNKPANKGFPPQPKGF